MVALQEIKKYQKSVGYLIRRASVIRIVREIAQDYVTNCNQEIPGFGVGELRFSPKALDALQTSAEEYLVSIMEDTQLLSINAKRITIQQKDM